MKKEEEVEDGRSIRGESDNNESEESEASDRQADEFQCCPKAEVLLVDDYAFNLLALEMML